MTPMLQTLLAWLLVALLVPSAYPLARGLLAYSPARDGRALTWALALALAVGGLTLIMFWMGVVGIPFSIPLIVAVYAIVVLGGGLWLRSSRFTAHSSQFSVPSSQPIDTRTTQASSLQNMPNREPRTENLDDAGVVPTRGLHHSNLSPQPSVLGTENREPRTHFSFLVLLLLMLIAAAILLQRRLLALHAR